LATLVITRRVPVSAGTQREFTEAAVGHLIRGFERVRR
jgi:hypothetical protein